MAPHTRALSPLLLLVALSAAHAADIFVPAEDTIVEGASRRAGYAFIEADDETADWASISSCPNPGFPNAPGRFALDCRHLPPGPYRLWVRLARWGGTQETTPVPSATFADNAGHRLDFTFPTDDSDLSKAFLMRPGGMVGPEGQWAWLPLFETGQLAGRYELTVTGNPGTGGAGNYKGLWLDAFRLDAVGPKSVGAPSGPALPEDKSLPGRWDDGYCLSPQGPGPGALSLVFPVTSSPTTALRRVLTKAVPTRGQECLALWLTSSVRLNRLWLTLRDPSGAKGICDVCQLANDRPLQPGQWYLLLAPLQGLQSVQSLEVSLPEGVRVPEGAIAVHAPRLTTLAGLRKELAAKTSPLSPEALGSARLTLAVHDYPRRPVGPDKKIIMWARGGMCGMPTPNQVRARIKELYPSGADGIVLTVDPIVDGKELYFADSFMSAQRFTEADFATQLADLKQIEWGPLSNSLLRLNVMPGTVDWFDDGWSAVVEKARLAARICRLGHLQGIMFDTEQYHWERGIFRYENRPLKDTKSVAEYARQATLRGQEMARALVAELPEIDVLTTFGGTIGNDGGPLLTPFLEGMASVAGCRVYDGCERTYPTRTLRGFLGWADLMRGYSRTIGRGFALWMNPPGGSYTQYQPEAEYRTPDGIAHALHYALRETDKYVWLYAEGDLTYWPDKTPAGYYDAIKRARQPQDPGWVPPSP